MKIKQKHFDHIQTAINNLLAEKRLANIVYEYEHGIFVNSKRVYDLQMRFCFDLFHMAGLTRYACDTLYSYMNDDHIYTALKKICPVVVRKY